MQITICQSIQFSTASTLQEPSTDFAPIPIAAAACTCSEQRHWFHFSALAALGRAPSWLLGNAVLCCLHGGKALPEFSAIAS